MTKTTGHRGKTNLGVVLEDVEETLHSSTAESVGTGNEIVKTISSGNSRRNGVMRNELSKPTNRNRVDVELVIGEVADLCREVRSSR